jgi:transposase
MKWTNTQQIPKEALNPVSPLSSIDSGIVPYLSLETILAIYNQSPEAVVQLVQALCAVIAEQGAIIAEQGVVITEQAARSAEQDEKIKSLEDQLSKNSRNSSKPPSTDINKKRRSLRGQSGKPVGGQTGHKGRTLEMVDDPDKVNIHEVHECQSCGMSLHDVQAIDFERRQVFDLPRIKVEVTEHRAESKICPRCGSLNKATFPEKVQHPIQYGSDLKAAAVYFSQYQLVPFERLSEIFEDLYGHHLSQGSLVNINRECYHILEPAEESIKQELIACPVVCFDETGMRIEGNREWCHTASTKSLTLYAANCSRGSKANEDMGILPVYKGTAMHDSWSSYFKFNCSHALCNAHHLRDLTFIHEEEKQIWAKEMIDLLIEIKNTVDDRKEIDSKLDPAEIKIFEEKYDRVIERGMLENPPPATSDPQGQAKKRGRKKQTMAQNLLDRLRKYRRESLAFMYDFRVPFDNNQAERDERMIKVQQKISGTFRSREGANTFCRIRGYISTARKNSIPVIDALHGAFEGTPFIPVGADS